MRKSLVASAVLVLWSTGVASAGPITMSVWGSSGTLSDVAIAGQNLSGSLSLSGSQEVFLQFGGFTRGTDYAVSLDLPPLNYTSVSVEILNAAGKQFAADNKRDPLQPSYVPAGWSTSNDMDGFSFAEASGLTRSFTAGATGFALTADETTDAHDLLTFTGLGVGDGSLMFGLRSQKWLGNPFLVRLVANSAGAAAAMPTPEPASMLLLGAGLVGAASAMRRRKQLTELRG